MKSKKHSRTLFLQEIEPLVQKYIEENEKDFGGNNGELQLTVLASCFETLARDLMDEAARVRSNAKT